MPRRRKKDVRRLRRRLRKRGDDLIEKFQARIAVLSSFGYVDRWTLSERGERLRGVYNEMDLLVVEAVEQGLLDDLSAPELAAIGSAFTYEPRREGYGPTRMVGRVAERLEGIGMIWREVVASEERRNLPPTREPESRFAGIAHAWALGASLDELFGDDDFAAGDFVRNGRQLLDLMRQLRDGFPKGRRRGRPGDPRRRSRHRRIGGAMVTGWFVVVNPTAGRAKNIAARADGALRDNAIEFTMRVPSSAKAVDDIVSEGVSLGYTNFASVGGDGSAHLVLNGLMHYDWAAPPTLSILSAGSGSDFIRTFALPRRLEDAAAHLVENDRYPCDVGLIEGAFGSRFFLNAANAGVAARSAAIAGRLPDVLGSVRYTAAFWIALGGFPTAHVHVEVNDRALEGDLMNVVVANGQFFGGGLNVAPRATVEDGVFDVQLFFRATTACTGRHAEGHPRQPPDPPFGAPSQGVGDPHRVS